MPNIPQPTSTPTRKVTAATLGQALVALAVILLEAFGVDVPAEAVAPLGVVATFTAGYYVYEHVDLP